jgi:O-methyltransferase
MTTGTSENAARLADAQAHLAAARAPHAAGPGAEAAAIRTAYLDLLKLCLCDLAGASSVSVGALPDGTVMARELRGDELRLRSAGMDWPLQGLTMVGLGRLDDLQACVETVVADGIEGDLIEAGAWRGGASILMRATLDSLGDERTLWVADSFDGFAAADDARADGIDLSAFDFLAVPLAEVRASFARLGLDKGVRFVPGYFEQTLAGLAAERWAVVRLDADTYEATKHALAALYPRLALGGYLIVDDYGSFEGCRRAVDEFRSEHGIGELLEHVDSTCSRWRRERETAMPAAPAATAAAAPGTPTPPAAGRARAAVPTVRELELARDLAAARAQLLSAEAEIARLRGAPWRRARAWLRRRPGRDAR